MGALIVVLRVVNIALDIIRWIVLVWVILSWVLFFLERSKVKWRYRQFCTRMTYPFLKPIRRWLRRIDTAGIDWSPLVLLLIIYLLQGLINWGAVAILSAG
jgi:uncharacterized protein YggT (Ycf19 family)